MKFYKEKLKSTRLGSFKDLNINNIYLKDKDGNETISNGLYIIHLIVVKDYIRFGTQYIIMIYGSKNEDNTLEEKDIKEIINESIEKSKQKMKSHPDNYLYEQGIYNVGRNINYGILNFNSNYDIYKFYEPLSWTDLHAADLNDRYNTMEFGVTQKGEVTTTKDEFIGYRIRLPLDMIYSLSRGHSDSNELYRIYIKKIHDLVISNVLIQATDLLQSNIISSFSYSFARLLRLQGQRSYYTNL